MVLIIELIKLFFFLSEELINLLNLQYISKNKYMVAAKGGSDKHKHNQTYLVNQN